MGQGFLVVAVVVGVGVVAGAQAPAAVPPDSTFHAVAYVEVQASATAAGARALKAYRETSRAQAGFQRVDLFEQIGRAGHFVVAEAWRDQAAFDAHVATTQKPLLDALQPIRISGYDQRPYKTLTVAASPASVDGRAVAVVSHVDVNQDPKVPVMLRGLAEESRREPGNVRFDIVQHAMRANHFTIVEVWRSQAALDAHVNAAHTKRYRDEVQPFTGSPLDERVFRPVE